MQPFKVMHWNAEGVLNKKTELENTLFSMDIQVCCIQETHLNKDKTFKVRGYQCFRCDRVGRSKGGILTLVRNNIAATQTTMHMDDSEYQLLNLKLRNKELKVVNLYSPNDKPLSLDTIPMEDTDFLVIGDFNSHSQSWGYDHMDRRGEEVETWQDDHNLLLINEPEDQPTFYSRRWQSTSTPDLGFCTEDIHKCVTREVGEQLGGSDHRPVYLTLQYNTLQEPSLPRWNYKKAKWGAYRELTDALCSDIRVDGRDIDKVTKDFNAALLKAAHKCIPRGSRRDYKPYWNDDLETLQEELSEARREAETHPSQDNNNHLQKARAKFLRTKIQARRKSWHEKTASLNLEKDSSKLWKLTRQLNDEGGHKRGTTAVEEDDSLLTGKHAANKFADNYEDVSNIQVNGERKREARREERERRSDTAREEVMETCLTLNELQTALKKLKAKKSPGPDHITNEMLTHLGGHAAKTLLSIFNLSWREGRLPQIWREAIMTPILKRGKNKQKAASYRPISLTSAVGKTMESIINQRMKWYLETNNLLANQQAGFRMFRSTEDQTTYLAQEVEDAFQAKKVTFVTWVDLQRAFDKVWTDGLLVKLQRCGIGGTMYKWIKSYLFNRRARVSLDGTTSRKFLQRHGVPQGGVLSPTLFLLFINDLIAELPRGVKAALYADDLVLWCSEEYATTARYRMQEAADKLTTWAEEWCVQVNTEKSCTTLFSLSPKQKAGAIKVCNTILAEVEEATYLGVTFDKRLTWKTHIANAESKARKRLSILRKLAGTNWGAHEKILRTIYLGTVRPNLEYGSTAWMSSAKTSQQRLDKVQNQALRLITGAMKSTPIKAMEEVTTIPPLAKRRESKALVQASKYQFLPDHPMKTKLEGLTKNRLKRSSYVHETKKLLRIHSSQLGQATAPLTAADLSEPWKYDLSNLNINTTVPGLTPSIADDTAKRTLTQAMINEHYPSETWTHVYTDGSASAAIKDGGAGIFINYKSGRSETVSLATGKHCTNYRAEVEAILQATLSVENSEESCPNMVIFTDALSVLQAFGNAKLPTMSRALGNLSKNRVVSLQWIPAHCGVPGNESADRLAKLGAKGKQPTHPFTHEEKKTVVKSLMKPKTTRDDYHLLDRWEQVIIFRLRTGHNRLNYHMHTKLKLSPSPQCPCGTEQQTAEHILQRCPRLETERKRVWPDMIPVQTKLFGNREELRRTASFVAGSGVTV